MTVQTVTGIPTLDPNDFQAVSIGVHWGLKLRYVLTQDTTYALDLIAMESGAFKELVLHDFEGELKQRGLADFVASVLIPGVNAWLKKRFSGAAPSPEPSNIPQLIIDLDKAIRALAVFDDAGVPQVK